MVSENIGILGGAFNPVHNGHLAIAREAMKRFDLARVIFIPAAVSNWGAYALAAAIALLTGHSACALEPEEERRMLNVAAVRGCCDGIRRRGAFGIDGLDGEASVRVVAALRDLVRQALAR